MHRLFPGVESSLEGKVSAVSAQCGATLSSELDKRVGGLYEHVDLQVGWCGGGNGKAAK